MSNLTIHHPHDSFFKHALSDVTVAKDLLQAHLSPSITQRIKWDTLNLSNKSYIDQKLSQLHSDVVYACQIDDKSAYIYILIEQQTTPDPLLPFRFLQYNVALLTEHLSQREDKNKKGLLPVIMNLCLYSGKQTPYPYSVDIHDCFEDASLASAEMFKPLSLIDLGQLSEEELKRHGTADLMELLLKQGRERTFLKWIDEHVEEIKKLLDGHYGISGIHYILGVEKQHSFKEVLDALKAIAPYKEEKIMTAAQQLGREYEKKGLKEGKEKGLKEGKERGLKEGIQQEKWQIAKHMLYNMHLSLGVVSQATGLGKEELMLLENSGYPRNGR